MGSLLTSLFKNCVGTNQDLAGQFGSRWYDVTFFAVLLMAIYLAQRTVAAYRHGARSSSKEEGPGDRQQCYETCLCPPAASMTRLFWFPRRCRPPSLLPRRI